MKKAIIFGLGLCLALFVIAAFTVGAPITHFSDVSGTENERYINYWYEKGAVVGYSDGTFRPDASLTRAEAASLLNSALTLNVEGKRRFSDVPKEFWAYDAISACAVQGIIKGYGDNTFRPNQALTRQEAMVIICRVSGYRSDSPEATISALADAGEIDSWARESIAALIESGVATPDQNGLIRPKDDMTRGDFVAMLYKIDALGGWNTVTPKFEVSYLSWTMDGIDGSRVYSQTVGGYHWLFLPAAADIRSLTLDFSASVSDEDKITFSGDLGSTDAMPLDLTALASPGDRGEYAVTIAVGEGKDAVSHTFFFISSEGLSAIFLTSDDPVSEGRAYVDEAKTNATTGHMTMLSGEGEVIYDDELTQLRSRGNSTMYYPKKSYQIKLRKKSDLLGITQRMKTWTLLAQYGDATLFRDKLCKDLAADMGLYGTPDSGWVDLYYDGIYRGTYQLSEKVQINPNGLFIRDLEELYERENLNYGEDVVPAQSLNKYGTEMFYVEDIIDPPDITTGFLLEENHHSGDENSWFRTTRGRAVNVKKPENISEAAMTYISELFQELEDAAYAQDAYGNYTGVNPITGKDYTEYVDLDSLARMYLIYYFSDNQDAYCQSTFYFLVDGKLYAGPMWDSDQSFGIGWSEEVPTDAELRYDHIVGGLVNVKSFREAVKYIYDAEFRDLALYYADVMTEEYTAEVSGSERLNHIIWPNYFNVSGVKSVYPEGTTYADTGRIAAEWMHGRIAFMDEKFADW